MMKVVIHNNLISHRIRSLKLFPPKTLLYFEGGFVDFRIVEINVHLLFIRWRLAGIGLLV